MKALFVITTRDISDNIPKSGFSQVKQELVKELDSFMEKEILYDQSVRQYLQDYNHDSIYESDEVKKYLKGCGSIPFFKRIVGDYGIYLSLCLSEEEGGCADPASHEYIGTLVQLAQKDIKEECGCEPDNVVVIVHEADLTFAKVPPRHFGQEECQSDILKGIPDGHIYLFWHELKCKIYNEFITKLHLDDDSLISACKTTLADFFGIKE